MRRLQRFLPLIFCVVSVRAITIIDAPLITLFDGMSPM